MAFRRADDARVHVQVDGDADAWLRTRLDSAEAGVRAVVETIIEWHRVGQTSDLWTDLSNESFMFLTLHYILRIYRTLVYAIRWTPHRREHCEGDDIEGAVTTTPEMWMSGFATSPTSSIYARNAS